MTAIKLFNTLTKKKEDFVPFDKNNIRMYVCGPTVYDRAHIGNARAMVIFDTLYNLLCHVYGIEKITYVRNITDVDDKINARAKERNIDITQLTQETIAHFHEDMSFIHCNKLHENENNSKRIEPHATKHIDYMIAMCEKLINLTHAYVAQEHVLFDVSSYNRYGNLSRRSKEEMIAGARVEIAPYKKNPSDFVLWKPSKDDEPGWQSPWGRGRPGWHIECSAMANKYLGENFDIHGGGIDLQFPHHENEIAQSCCANPNSSFAKYWVHNGFLTVNGEKMSKSLGNFITIDELRKKNIKGEVIRYVLLSAHYSKPLDWSDKSLSDAQKSIDYFYNALAKVENIKIDYSTINNTKLIEILGDDLNTPNAIAYLHELAHNLNKETNEESKNILACQFLACGNLLGLIHLRKQFLPLDIENKFLEYKQARANKDWSKSDILRKELSPFITIRDSKEGSSYIIKDDFKNPIA